jgi:hypothetical protein
MSQIENEPFLLRKRSAEEIADYDLGFQAGANAEEADDTKSEAWQHGWAEPMCRGYRPLTISSSIRCFSFIATAANIVRKDLAVRPCFPMT